jgi:hypothetical protein
MSSAFLTAISFWSIFLFSTMRDYELIIIIIFAYNILITLTPNNKELGWVEVSIDD